MCVAILIPAYFFLSNAEVIKLSLAAFCTAVAIINIMLFCITFFACGKNTRSFGMSYFISCFIYLTISAIFTKAGIYTDSSAMLMQTGSMCLAGVNVVLLLLFIGHEIKRSGGSENNK